MRLLNISQLGRAFGLHRQTVRRRLEDAGIKPYDAWRGIRRYRIGAVARVLVTQEQACGPANMAPVQRRAWFQSEHARVDVALAQGRLVPAGDFHRELASIAKNIASLFETLPDELERAGYDPDALDRVEAWGDRQRERMYHALVSGAR